MATRQAKWLHEHPEYHRKVQKKYRENNPETVKATNRAADFKRRYGITIAQYNEMLERQNGVCAICGGVNDNGKRLFVDHNHTTGAVRGLLCYGCNFVLGGSKDNTITLLKAIKYLETHSEEVYASTSSKK